MSRALRLVLVAAAGAVAALILLLAAPGTGTAELAVLAAALVAGELIELRPINRAALPLSLAVTVVMIRACSPTQFIIVIGVAYLIGVAVRLEPPGLSARVLLFLERIAAALIAAGAYRIVLDVAEPANRRAAVLAALAAAALCEIVVHDLVAAASERRFAVGHGPGGDVALVTSAILMAVGYRGIDGDGQLGLWGLLLFSVLLLAAWYSFELLASTRRNFRQTVRALGVAPELGGLVRAGHAERVAEMVVAIGHELSMDPSDVEHLETAALLHHLGAVCLDEPADGSSHDPVAVAEAGAQMLRRSDALASAGEIVAAELLLHRHPVAREATSAALAGQVLKVASAFDELTEGDPDHAAWAIEALFTGPSYVYDGRVLDALERVVVRRGLLAV